MPDSILYLLKVNLAIALFYLGYRLLLRKLTFYTLNRFYLLFALLFSFAYPLVDWAGLFAAPAQELPGSAVYLIPDWERVPAEAFNGWPLLVGAVVLGAAWFFVKFVVRLLSLWRIHGQSHAATWQWFRYRQVSAAIQPFSFWRSIYVNVHNHADGELAEIFKHEQAHVSELHTLDVLLAELCSVLCWFNPAMWLFRHAVHENLEFIADWNVLRTGVDKQTYQYSLLGAGRPLEAHPAIAQGFNFKNLKTRMMMMNKKRSSQLQLGRYLFTIPAIAVFVLLFTMSRAAYLPENSEVPNVPERAIDAVQPIADVPAVQREAVSDTTKAKREVSAAQVIQVIPKGADAPLMILDGKELEEGFDINTIDPKTIASISILKDASATARFGKKGAKGVVVISSKGKAQKDAVETAIAEPQEEQVTDDGKRDRLEISVAAADFDGALIVIDGKESTLASLRQLSPDDIKAIRVWKKGPEATKEYGDKAAKGVIEITTEQ